MYMNMSILYIINDIYNIKNSTNKYESFVFLYFFIFSYNNKTFSLLINLNLNFKLIK